MVLSRSARWFLPALLIFVIALQQQSRAQIPVGTERTGTFVWDGQRWVPGSEYFAHAPAPEADDSSAILTVTVEPPALPVYEQPPCPEPNLIWTPG